MQRMQCVHSQQIGCWHVALGILCGVNLAGYCLEAFLAGMMRGLVKRLSAVQYSLTNKMSTRCKAFSLIIQQRLVAWADSQLLELQCGFRQGRSCDDAIFCMRLLHEHAVRKPKTNSRC